MRRIAYTLLFRISDYKDFFSGVACFNENEEGAGKKPQSNYGWIITILQDY